MSPDPIAEKTSIGNTTVTVQEAPPLSTVMYGDAKHFLKVVGKFLVAGVILVLVYHYFDYWGILSFGVMFMISYRWLIPVIAERFMTFVSLLNIDMDPAGRKPNSISLIQISHSRFEKAFVLNDLNERSALNSPFLSTMGLTYVIDGLRLDENIAPPNAVEPVLADFVRINPCHKNVDFVHNYEPEFLRLRLDYLKVSNELFALKSRLEILAEERANLKAYTILQMVEDAFNKVPEDPLNFDALEGELRTIREMLELGLDINDTKHKNLIQSQIVKPREVSPV
jgi:hypothetical protein